MQDYFDSQTGEIIEGNAGNTSSVGDTANAGGSDSMSYTSDISNAYESSAMPDMNMAAQPPRKKRTWLWVCIGCVGAVAVAVAVVLVIKLFLNPAVKIGIAMANTFKEKSQIQKDLDIIDMLADGNAGIQMNMEYNHQTIDMSGMYNFSNKHKALNVKVNGNLDGIGDFELDYTAELDKDKLAISLKPAIDEMLTYYYKEDNKGYIIDNLGRVDVNKMNNSLKNLYELEPGSDGKYRSMWSIIAEAVWKEAKNIKMEKLDKKEEFKINGKMRNCGGYQMEITKDDMEAMIDSAREAVENELDNIGIEGKIRDDIADKYDDIFDELEDGISGMKDVDLSFYIYDSQIACIHTEVSRYTTDIIFHGGDYPTQNVEVVLDGGIYNDETIFELTGKKKDKTEEMEFFIDDDSLFELEYDIKSGELSVESDIVDTKFEAVVKRTKSDLSVEIDDIEDISLGLTITDKGTIEALKGDEIDLGAADEETIDGLTEDVYNEYEDLIYYMYEMLLDMVLS